LQASPKSGTTAFPSRDEFPDLRVVVTTGVAQFISNDKIREQTSLVLSLN
jgi:hypothetical protein